MTLSTARFGTTRDLAARFGAHQRDDPVQPVSRPPRHRNPVYRRTRRLLITIPDVPTTHHESRPADLPDRLDTRQNTVTLHFTPDPLRCDCTPLVGAWLFTTTTHCGQSLPMSTYRPCSIPDTPTFRIGSLPHTPTSQLSTSLRSAPDMSKQAAAVPNDSPSHSHADHVDSPMQRVSRRSTSPCLPFHRDQPPRVTPFPPTIRHLIVPPQADYPIRLRPNPIDLPTPPYASRHGATTQAKLNPPGAHRLFTTRPHIAWRLPITRQSTPHRADLPYRV